MDKKHQQFLKRVYDLYNRYGIKSVTMDDVARELAMSKKTLYECIKDKAELVEQVLAMNSMYHAQKLNDIVSENMNAIEELIVVNKYMNRMMKEQNPTLAYDMKKYYPEIHSRILLAQRERMHAAIQKNLKKGIKEGFYRKEMNVEIVAKIHMTRMEYRYSTDKYVLSDVDSEVVMREIFVYHLHGISNEKGVQEIKKQINKYWK